ncbi:DUF4352 domain-containing protein [Methanosarcina mazei]|uniref:DUF4352 domain-containing protein n=1 Tax=Methanosarcina mazei TaxID=2209 RepID=UPI00064F22E5|nr:DUF4352 domain-containing protein [Methanosarcina mazei]
MKKHLIIFMVLAVLFAAGCAESSGEETNISSEKSSGVQEVAQEVPASIDVCYWDWQYAMTPSIGQYYIAPAGYNYVIATVYLKNNANVQVSTNPYFWKFTADGLQYDADVSTFSDVINHQNIEVGKGGEIETTIVYLVKGSPVEAEIGYYNYQYPLFERIEHYQVQ